MANNVDTLRNALNTHAGNADIVRKPVTEVEPYYGRSCCRSARKVPTVFGAVSEQRPALGIFYFWRKRDAEAFLAWVETHPVDFDLHSYGDVISEWECATPDISCDDSYRGYVTWNQQ